MGATCRKSRQSMRVSDTYATRDLGEWRLAAFRLIPTEPARPDVGRPRVPDRARLAGSCSFDLRARCTQRSEILKCACGEPLQGVTFFVVARRRLPSQRGVATSPRGGECASLLARMLPHDPCAPASRESAAEPLCPRVQCVCWVSERSGVRRGRRRGLLYGRWRQRSRR